MSKDTPLDPVSNDEGEDAASLIDAIEKFWVDFREHSLQNVYNAERSLARIGRPVRNPTRPERSQRRIW